ncbi:MAG: ABC transporter substrate-binding protein [Hyphomicrobiales bacterium]|nr:ABC transporter substrate-binding protein [Hyphomicrobiales bacterium]
MRRRIFILGLGTAMVARPLGANAQPAAISRVGYVWVGRRGTNVSGAGLRKGLSDLGYEIGRNITLEERYADDDGARVPTLISELLAQKVDLLVTPGSFATLAARRATSTVPIVFVSGDPVKAGIVASLNRPGGNATGMSILASDYSAKWLELMKDALPKLTRVAVLRNLDSPSTSAEIERMKTAAQALGVDLSLFRANAEEIEQSLASIANGAFDGLALTTDPSLESLTTRVISFAAEHRLPAIYPFSFAVEQGGLMSYATDLFEMWRHVASYVDRILKGEKPADLPVEQVERIELKINLKTARALGLVMPASLLARADEVIE